ncbi:DUF3606 domain-containing protein [Terrirubrum flagellatum]|uniref:DUF3606 domain-containing protein n=1 Tax=Terrirubrum flagellatum TaxID=2895980 RepID=UPI003CC81539
MSADLKTRGAGDAIRINVNEPYEVAYWIEELNCSEKASRGRHRSRRHGEGHPTASR